jgi:murein DD-endopeptidase MepM/ murein hydrolase activator NlpD
MQHSPAKGRRRARTLRRRQTRRRRAVALAVLVTLIALALWAAYAIPGATPARVPANAALPTFGQSPSGGADSVVASVEGIDVLLPVAREVTTAIGYHAVDNADAVAFVPNGDLVSGGGISQRLADIFAGGGGVRYYLMQGVAGGASPATAGLDVGAVPGSPVVSPADGKVVAVKPYSILGRFPDTEVDIQLAADPSLLLLMTHLTRVRVQLGDDVTGGETVLGAVRGFPTALEQTLSTYTSDAGDHVQLTVLRVTPGLAGL